MSLFSRSLRASPAVRRKKNAQLSSPLPGSATLIWKWKSLAHHPPDSLWWLAQARIPPLSSSRIDSGDQPIRLAARAGQAVACILLQSVSDFDRGELGSIHPNQQPFTLSTLRDDRQLFQPPSTLHSTYRVYLEKAPSGCGADVSLVTYTNHHRETTLSP